MTDNTYFINLYKNNSACNKTKRCEKYIEQFETRMIGRLVKTPGMEKDTPPLALIALDKYENYETFIKAARKIHKANAVRKANRCSEAGYITEIFAWKNFIPDVYEINTSVDVRSGGAMKPAYHRSVDELGGEPEKKYPVDSVKCPKHHTWCWGVFIDRPGYKQGSLEVDKKLLAYIKVKRQGNLLIYTSILGHGDYLNKGIMFKLHFDIMSWIYDNRADVLNGVDFIIYSGFNDGTEGLKTWKKRALFEKAFLAIK